MEIKIKYHNDVEKITKIKGGDWIDLRCAEDTKMEKGDYCIISLGVSMQLPSGYFAEIAPRSSTFSKYKILMANSIGVIDEDYNADSDIWGFPAYAVADTFIAKNTRIAQFRIVKKQPEFEFTEVETLGNDARGGFGSTGEK